jgi:hypothetical protein
MGKDVGVEQRQERQARNEALVREVNERIEQLDQAAEETDLAGAGRMFEFLCECGRADESEVACDAHVELTLEEYEQVRTQDDRFVLVPGHEDASLEAVVRGTERFVIVDKKPAAEPFVADDPRGAGST